MESLEEMGKKAYQKQVWGSYDEAIEIYSNAVRKYHEDARILNNRCMCYVEVKDYKSAMEDADTLIQFYPTNIKSYYRRAEVLKAMESLEEAEQAFQQVLNIDPNCEDARQQLLDTQISLVCSSGPYTRTQAVKALIFADSVKDAKELLRSQPQKFNQDSDDVDEIYYSDEDITLSTVSTNTEYDPLTDPSNPLGCCTLWVGHVSEAVTEKLLTELFSKYGRLKSVHVYHDKTCAFINYADASSPGKAMKALNGQIIGGKNVTVRFPDNAYSTGLTAAAYKKKHKHP